MNIQNNEIIASSFSKAPFNKMYNPSNTIINEKENISFSIFNYLCPNKCFGNKKAENYKFKIFLKSGLDVIKKRLDISYLLGIIYFIEKNISYDDNLKESMIHENFENIWKSDIKGESKDMKNIPKSLNENN